MVYASHQPTARLRAMRRLPARGVGLIEVLIAVVILGFGLVAVALLQTSAIQNNFLSNQFTIAANVAQGLSEAMRGNRFAVVSAARSYDIVAGTVPPDPPVNCATASCRPGERAAWDLANTYAAINDGSAYTKIPGATGSLLPGGQLQIQCGDVPCAERSPRVITVYWDADRSGATGYGCQAKVATDLKCFRLVHVP